MMSFRVLAALTLQVSMSAAMLLKPQIASTPAPYWPEKGGNLNHTGLSAFSAPHRLERAAWIFEPKHTSLPSFKANGKTVGMMQVFHTSPILDSEKNSYIVATTGWLYSVDPQGNLRWEFELSGTNPGNPALLDGVLYAEADDGVAFAIEAATGHEIWRARVADSASTDVPSIVVAGNTAIMQGNSIEDSFYATPPVPAFGTSQLVAIDTSDGSIKWKYDVTKRSGEFMVNAEPAIVGGSVLVADTAGGVYRISLEDGKETWYNPGTAGTRTTGNMAVGPNNMVYVTGQYESVHETFLGLSPVSSASYFAEFNGLGILRAIDFHSGSVHWTRKFDRSAQVAPAVGPVGPHGKLSVVVPIGDNMPPAPMSDKDKLYFTTAQHPRGGDLAETSVYALDAQTGEEFWSLKIPAANYTASSKGSSKYSCSPDIWGTPAIDADGVVFLNWSGGRAFAIRDANHDGKIDQASPLELSSFEHGYGTNGNSAIAPGLLVAPSCNLLIGFTQ